MGLFRGGIRRETGVRCQHPRPGVQIAGQEHCAPGRLNGSEGGRCSTAVAEAGACCPQAELWQMFLIPGEISGKSAGFLLFGFTSRNRIPRLRRHHKTKAKSMKVILTTLSALALAGTLSFAEESHSLAKMSREDRREHRHKDRIEDWKEKLEKMSPEDHREYVAKHPELRERIYKHWEERLEKMSREDRREFLKKHPEFREHLRKHRHKERA